MEYKWIFLALTLATIVYTTTGRSYVRQPVPRCPNFWIKRNAEIHRLRDILEERKHKGKGKPNKPGKGKGRGSKDSNESSSESKSSKDSSSSSESKESKSDETLEFDTTTVEFITTDNGQGTTTGYFTSTDDSTSTDNPESTSTTTSTLTSTSTTPFVFPNPCSGFCREFCLVTEREELGASCAPFTWCKCCV